MCSSMVWYLEVCLHNHCEVGVVCLRHVLLVLAQLDCHNVAQVRTRVIPAQQQTQCQAVIRICDILKRIQIRILGSVHCITDPDPYPALFVRGFQDVNKNKFFSLLLTIGIFKSDFKEKKSLRSHKTIEIKVFLIYLVVDGRIRNWIRKTVKCWSGQTSDLPDRWSKYPDSGQVAFFLVWKHDNIEGKIGYLLPLRFLSCIYFPPLISKFLESVSVPTFAHPVSFGLNAVPSTKKGSDPIPTKIQAVQQILSINIVNQNSSWTVTVYIFQQKIWSAPIRNILWAWSDQYGNKMVPDMMVEGKQTDSIPDPKRFGRYGFWSVSGYVDLYH